MDGQSHRARPRPSIQVTPYYIIYALKHYWFIFCKTELLLQLTPDGHYNIPYSEQPPVEIKEWTTVHEVDVPFHLTHDDIPTSVKSFRIDTPVIDLPGYEMCGLRASFDNPSELFRNGSNGYLVLPTTKHGVIVIPQDATIRIQDKSFVYRVVEGKAVFTEVKGKLSSDKQSFVVTDGLKDGDVIVIENVGLVTEGMAITQEREEKESK